MIDDPIVNEVRRIRREYAEEFQNDLRAICEDLRRQERESAREFRTPGMATTEKEPHSAPAATSG